MLTVPKAIYSVIISQIFFRSCPLHTHEQLHKPIRRSYSLLGDSNCEPDNAQTHTDRETERERGGKEQRNKGRERGGRETKYSIFPSLVGGKYDSPITYTQKYFSMVAFCSFELMIVVKASVC